ncbi:MAG: RNA methyltransferase [Prolixibacteraceae bacterium]|nr:RNA methyltransferase [Prolixibacteraceae bacterium]MDD4755379.1 RNA methyltransferase [Prolixibacteraceae bacterium]NLO01078.1 RNA methyltransferase [Bacteroidales bacterium]
MQKLHINELKRLTVDEFKKADKTPIVVVLENVRSSNNIGSVFRTSDALLIEKIILCGISSTPPDKEIHKTALDAEKSVNWEYFKETEDALLKLRAAGYKIYAVEQVKNSISLNDFHPEGKIALIFGNEVRGVSQKIINICDGAVEIPQFGTKHSFNIAVSAGIVLWDLFSKITR